LYKGFDLQSTNGFVDDQDDYLRPYLQAADFMVDYINRQRKIQKMSSFILPTSPPLEEEELELVSAGGERRDVPSAAAAAAAVSNHNNQAGPGIKRDDRRPPRHHSERRPSLRRSCVYCLRNGKNVSMYNSHCLRNPLTKNIMCPELKEKLCALCKDTGDDQVHASDECPQTAFASVSPPLSPGGATNLRSVM